jgi:nucleoside-diphosphate-sugar epimerase
MIKKILLTGATGFIGSHLLEKLIQEDYDVIILKRSFSDCWRIKNLLNKVKIYDIDKIKLETIFKENNDIDCIVHLSTLYIKNHKDENDTGEMIDSNIKFPTILVDLGVKAGVKAFINTGTFFEYKNTNNLISENSEISPCSFYASTKVAFTQFLKYYSNVFGLKVFDFKLFTPFGEKDNEKLIVSMIKSFITGEKLQCSGGNQMLSFTYIEDIVDAYIQGIKKIEEFTGYEAFNVGYKDAYSIREVASELEKISNNKSSIVWGTVSNLKNEISCSVCDNQKIINELDWTPNYSLRSGLSNTYNFYLNKK